MAPFYRKLSGFKKITVIVLLIGLVGGLLLWRYNSHKNPADAYEISPVKYADISGQVKVTGTVKPAEDVDLGFERSGRVARVYKAIGDSVHAGETVVVLENGDLSANVLESRANLEAAQAALAELEAGTRPEDIAAAQVRLDNAYRSLADADKSLADARSKADADLAEAYSGALTAAQTALQTAKGSLISITNIQSTYFSGGLSDDDIRLADAKAAAVQELFGVSNAGHWGTGAVSALQSGLYADVQKTAPTVSAAMIDGLLLKTASALQSTKRAVEAVVVSDKMTAPDKTTVSTERGNISTEITTVTGKEQGVIQQRTANTAAINAAQSALTTAKNTVFSAKSDLNTKKAGTVPQQIDAARARVNAAGATLASARAQLGKTILIAPIDGTISKQDAKPGQIVSPNGVLTSIISNEKFELEAKIPESDIAKVAVGQSAHVTLDAYPGETFDAVVIFIEPAETLTEGVATYKVTFRFGNADERIRSGMTADVDLTTATRTHVLTISQRAIIPQGDKKTVRVFEGNQPKEKIVQTGISGTDGTIEILSGLNEGEQVIVGEKK